jgi:leucyl aminopeptidase
MKYITKTEKLVEIKANCFVVAVFQGLSLSPSAKQIDKKLQGRLSQAMKNGDYQGDVGEILPIFTDHPSFPQVIVVGMGSEASLSEHSYLKTLDAIGAQLKRLQGKSICHSLIEVKIPKRNLNWNIRQTILKLSAQQYQFTQCKSMVKKPAAKPNTLIFPLSNSKQTGLANRAIQEASAMSIGIATAKDLGNLPGNICTPRYLAQQAKQLEKKYQKLSCKILTEKECQKLGMNTFLSVSAGSNEPARLIVLEYRGSRRTERPVALVGKGVTFDSGGLSLKPGQRMDEMKFDMCGAASVFGTVQAVAELGLPVNLIAVLACTENLPGSKATKPGDIITSMDGQTVEILNTDAEGRLVLCDALCYARRFKPEVVIDVATLTGAMVVALGAHATGLLANDDALAEDLLSAGNDIYERAWRLPIWPEYQEALESNFADMANIGDRAAGSITAACFLARFTKQLRWAHLDIAAVAWHSGKQKGATGRPVALLMQYLLNFCNKPCV